MGRIMPYYHYIVRVISVQWRQPDSYAIQPIQSDYSDVFNVMAFFLGDPETGVGGHDDIAEKIGRHASEYARKYWRWEDMEAYVSSRKTFNSVRCANGLKDVSIDVRVY
jgi:hypothetical protein